MNNGFLPILLLIIIIGLGQRYKLYKDKKNNQSWVWLLKHKWFIDSKLVADLKYLQKMKKKVIFYVPGLIILLFNYKLAILYSIIISIYFLYTENRAVLKKKP